MTATLSTAFRVTISGVTYTGAFSAIPPYMDYVDCDTEIDAVATEFAAAVSGLYLDMDLCDDNPASHTQSYTCTPADPPTCDDMSLTGVTLLSSGRIQPFTCEDCGLIGVGDYLDGVSITSFVIAVDAVTCEIDVSFDVYFSIASIECKPSGVSAYPHPSMTKTVSVSITDIPPRASVEAIYEAALAAVPGTYAFTVGPSPTGEAYAGNIVVTRI